MNKHQIYQTNLCREILLSAQQIQCTLDATGGILYVPYISPKYKFSRANWYQAEFDVKYYEEVEEWCEQQFGPHPKNPDAWSRWWHKFEESILFRDEKDYVLFVLRWS